MQLMNSSKYPVSGRDQYFFCGKKCLFFFYILALAAEPDMKSTITANSIAISILWIITSYIGHLALKLCYQ